MISAVMVYITVCQICVFVLQLEQFRAIFIQFCIKIGQKTDNKKTAEICGNLGSGNNWTRTSDIRINSPLFYRLNYARTARISYNLFYPISSTFFIRCDFTFLVLYFYPSNKKHRGSKMLLKGKKILITGVANDWSMAWAIARRAHDEGAEIAMPYAMPNLEKRVRPLAESIGAKFVQECNVQNDEQMDDLFNKIEQEWGRLDGMLHAIAFSDKNELTGRYADTTRANFKNTMDVSVYSLVDLTRRASKLMTDGGSIVTLTYYGGEKSVPNYNVMGVAKSALDSSVRYLASDLGRDRIRINAISAGPIMTLASSGVGGMKSMLRLNAEQTPLRRNMTLDDVSGAAIYLFSDLSSAVTGEVHHVDCGYSTTGMIPNDLKDVLLRGLDEQNEQK